METGKFDPANERRVRVHRKSHALAVRICAAVDSSRANLNSIKIFKNQDSAKRWLYSSWKSRFKLDPSTKHRRFDMHGENETVPAPRAKELAPFWKRPKPARDAHRLLLNVMRNEKAPDVRRDRMAKRPAYLIPNSARSEPALKNPPRRNSRRRPLR